MANRSIGRTKRMLLELAQMAGMQERILVIAHNYEYSSCLLRQLADIFEAIRYEYKVRLSNNTIEIFGTTYHFDSIQNARSDKYRGIHFDTIAHDHAAWNFTDNLKRQETSSVISSEEKDYSDDRT